MQQARGFTLVEVLVALLIMALMAVMGWRGIDSMANARIVSQAASERSLLLGAVIGQFEQDLQAVQDTIAAPGLAFDGASLRLTRRTEGGMQLVVWSVREGVWQRWTTPAMTKTGELQEAWMRSQQLQGNEPQQLRVLDGVQGWQLYYYRENGWSNAQSTGTVVTAPAGSASAPPRELLPSGVRMVMELPEGTLTRDVLMRGPG